ncbi:16S rRNA (adenine(1518)-N(6)/adenine(1519)-N(6))-dimethyltransferaseRsmA [soil metagenome]
MNNIRPKKYLGQHFLKDLNIAEKIVNSLTRHRNYQQIIEIGPGTGVLTQFLMKMSDMEVFLVEIDKESVAYLKGHLNFNPEKIIEDDFLKLPLHHIFKGPFGIIGNLPYNISSQIFFKILENKNSIPEIVCMIQKEVAERLASPPGNKTYGILSVLLQAFYKIEYLFTVKPHVFNPPPKVDSAVIRLTRNEVIELECDEKLFFRIVKQGFNNRRKTLRNALKPINLPPEITELDLLNMRAEQLSVQDFINLTQKSQELWKK